MRLDVSQFQGIAGNYFDGRNPIRIAESPLTELPPQVGPRSNLWGVFHGEVHGAVRAVGYRGL